MFKRLANGADCIRAAAEDAYQCWEANDLEGAWQHLEQITEDLKTLLRQSVEAEGQLSHAMRLEVEAASLNEASRQNDPRTTHA